MERLFHTRVVRWYSHHLCEYTGPRWIVCLFNIIGALSHKISVWITGNVQPDVLNSGTFKPCTVNPKNSMLTQSGCDRLRCKLQIILTRSFVNRQQIRQTLTILHEDRMLLVNASVLHLAYTCLRFIIYNIVVFTLGAADALHLIWIIAEKIYNRIIIIAYSFLYCAVALVSMLNILMVWRFDFVIIVVVLECKARKKASSLLE